MKRIFIVVAILFLVNSSATQAMVVSGTVKDSASGTALSNIYVALRSNATLARDTTDTAGAYSIAWDTMGDYTLRAMDLSNLYPQTSVGVTIDSTDKTVDILMVKPPTTAVSGTITDSTTGTAIGGAVVSLRGGTTTLTDTADTGGVYSISVPYAAYRITATAKGYSPKRDSVTVADTTTQTKNFQLVGLVYSSISGKVTDSASGTALQNAKIVLYSGSRAKIDSAVTDTAGAYSIDSIPVGTYSITATYAAYNQKSDSVTLADTAAKTLDISLVKTIYGMIAGTITDSASTTALADAKVVLSRGSGATRTRLDSTFTDTTGTYSFDSIPIGTYSIIVTCATYNQKRSDSVTITDTTTKTADIALVKTVYCTVTGTISDSTAGTALSEAKVMLYSGMMRAVDSAVTDTTGAYSFDSLVVGTYSVTVSRDGFITKTDSTSITDTATKTLNVALAKKVFCTITGIVTDSATGAAMAGIPVALRWIDAGGARILIDSTVTDSSGAYSLDSAFTGAYVRSSPAGFIRKAIDLTVSSETAQKIDFALATDLNAVRFPGSTNKVQGIPSVTVMPGGNLHLINGNSVTAICLYSLNGRLLGKQTINPEAIPSVLSIGKPVSCGKYIVRLDRKGSVLQQMIFIP